MTDKQKNLTMVNGSFESTISIADRGLNYGDGLFETIAIHEALPLLWDLHWQRLERSCLKLLIDIPDKSLVENELNILAEKITRGIIKIIITRGNGERGYKPNLAQPSTRILVATANSENETKLKNIEIFICKHVIYPDPQLAGIKHLNRLSQVLASVEQEKSDKMGILCDNRNNIVEGISSNIFLVINNRLSTPDLSEYGVSGVMREYVLEQARILNIDVEISRLDKSRLLKADEIFLTNSIIGILPVNHYDGKVLEAGEVTNKIMKAIGQDNYYN